MAKLTKRGNSLGVNIHPIILKKLDIKEGDELHIVDKGKSIVITKVKE